MAPTRARVYDGVMPATPAPAARTYVMYSVVGCTLTAPLTDDLLAALQTMNAAYTICTPLEV